MAQVEPQSLAEFLSVSNITAIGSVIAIILSIGNFFTGRRKASADTYKTLSETVRTLSMDIQERDVIIDGLRDRISALETAARSDRMTIESYKNTIADLEESRNRNRRTVEDMRRELQGLREQTEADAATITSYRLTIDDLETQVKGRDREISSLKGRLTKLANKVKALETRNGDTGPLEI